MNREPTPTGVSPSQEDYLEAIFWLTRENRVARSRDISQRLRVTKPSVTTALRQLGTDGLIHYTPYSFVTLTDAGAKIARSVVRRHAVLQDFLHRVIGLEATEADALACILEHSISNKTLDHFEAFMSFADSDGPDLAKWMNQWKEKRQQEGKRS